MKVLVKLILLLVLLPNSWADTCEKLLSDTGQRAREIERLFQHSDLVRFFDRDKETLILDGELLQERSYTLVIYEGKLVLGHDIKGDPLPGVTQSANRRSRSHVHLYELLGEGDINYLGQGGAIQFLADGTILVSGYHLMSDSTEAVENIIALIRKIIPDAKIISTPGKLKEISSYKSPKSASNKFDISQIKTKLSQASVDKIRSVVVEEDSENELISDMLKRTPKWAIEAMDLYIEGRLQSSNIENDENRPKGPAILGTENKDEVEANSSFISLPRKFKRSIFLFLLYAHEYEHNIQDHKLEALGLEDPYTSLIQMNDFFEIELEAMRAEWEFANSLPAQAQAELKSLIDDFVSEYAEELEPMRAVTQLSLQDYIIHNHKLGRYSQENVEVRKEKDLAWAKRRLEETELERLIGSWKIPRSVLRKPLESYLQFINRALPFEVRASLTWLDDDTAELRVFRVE